MKTAAELQSNAKTNGMSFSKTKVSRDWEGMEEGVTGHLRLNTVIGTQEISESESEDAKLVVDQHRAGKPGLTEEDVADWWMKGEVGDSKKVDAGMAYQLADSLDQRLGFPTMPRASSAASAISGDKDSDTT